MANITYRGNGVWGTGKGSPLTSAEVDTNFYQLGRSNLNLIANGSAEMGTKYWSSDIAFTANLGSSGSFFDAGNTSGGAASTHYFITDKFPVSAGIQYTYSCEYQTVGYVAADLYCDIQYTDNNGAVVKDGDNFLMPSPDMGWYSEFSFTDTVPSGATYAQFRIVCTNAKWTALRWKSCMVSSNRNFSTPFNTTRDWWNLTQTGWSWKNSQEFNGPAWTGTDAAASNSVFLGIEGAASNGNPIVGWKKKDAPADQKHWNIYTNNTDWRFRMVNDAWNAVTDVITATRSGMTLTGLNFGRRPTFAGNLAWDAGNFNPSAYLPNAGGVLSGWLTIDTSSSSNDSVMFMRSIAGRAKYVSYQTGNSTRWQCGVNGTAESGSNAGSDWYFSRFADNGTYIDDPIVINRASGNIQLKGRTDGGAVPAGKIGEVLTFNSNPSGVPINAGGSTAVLGVTLPAGIWLCTLRSILKDGGGSVINFVQDWNPPAVVGMSGYSQTQRPRDGNWQSVTTTFVTRSSVSNTSQVTWSVSGDNGSAGGQVDVIAIRIA